jgi:hypothetical protein
MPGAVWRPKLPRGCIGQATVDRREDIAGESAMSPSRYEPRRFLAANDECDSAVKAVKVPRQVNTSQRSDTVFSPDARRRLVDATAGPS